LLPLLLLLNLLPDLLLLGLQRFAPNVPHDGNQDSQQHEDDSQRDQNLPHVFAVPCVPPRPLGFLARFIIQVL